MLAHVLYLCLCPTLVLYIYLCPPHILYLYVCPPFFCMCAHLISYICICAHLLNLKLLPDRAESFPRVGIDPRHQSCWPISNPCLGKIFQIPWKVLFFSFQCLGKVFFFLILKHHESFPHFPISNAWGIYRVSQKCTNRTKF